MQCYFPIIDLNLVVTRLVGSICVSFNLQTIACKSKIGKSGGLIIQCRSFIFVPLFNDSVFI